MLQVSLCHHVPSLYMLADWLPQVTTKYINGLIELIHSNLNTTDNPSGLENPRKHFHRTLEYIASREYEGVETRPK